MDIFSEKLVRSKELEKKIETACSFNNAKCKVIEGKVISISKTNVSFIEPHKIIIRCKNKKILLLYFDKDNLFLYSRRLQIDLVQLGKILEIMRRGAV